MGLPLLIFIAYDQNLAGQFSLAYKVVLIPASLFAGPVKNVFYHGSQAVALASALHYKKLSLKELRSNLVEMGIKVRSFE